MSNSVTIRDVARHAGVGVGTVSRVLNDSESVRDSTRLKVLASIQNLNYSPSAVARNLSSGNTMALGVVVPFFTNDSVVQRLQGIVSVIGSSHYDLVLFDLEKSENRENLLANIAGRRLVDGLLILSMLPEEGDLQRFLESDIPGVMVDAYHPHLPSIVVDNEFGAWQAARHLLDLGHRRIGYLSDFPDNPFNSAPVLDRYAGFRKALSDAGVPFPADYYVECGVDRADARQMAHELLALDERPTAIFAYCDIQAIGALEAARDLGLRVPQELSVIGYDGIDAAEYAQLTTIRQSLFESGVRGAELLLQVMAGHHLEEKEVRLQTELVVRGTTAPPA